MKLHISADGGALCGLDMEALMKGGALTPPLLRTFREIPGEYNRLTGLARRFYAAARVGKACRGCRRKKEDKKDG